MTFLLQVDFKMNGPFGKDMVNEFTDLATSINEENGFLWKIWTENEERKEAGGIYLFITKIEAEKYLDKYKKRLTEFGIPKVNGKIFSINEELTKINNGPVAWNR